MTEQEPQGETIWTITRRDLDDLDELIKLKPWQKDRVGYWLDHLRLGRINNQKITGNSST